MRPFLCGLLAMVLSGSGLAQKRGYDTLPNVPAHYEARLAQFEKEPVVKGKVLFLGNSITEGGHWKRLLKDSSVINRGISGDNTFGVLKRMGEVTQRQPSKLFLLIGINDFSKDIPVEVVMENIFTIVKQVRSRSPETQIFVQSVLPLNPAFENFPKRFDKRTDVLTLNAQLARYAPQFKYTFVNLYPAFSDSNGYLNEKLTYDGLHLNAAGYTLWVEELKKFKYL